jgi:sugar phosphate isomerase/epimerase
MSGMSRREFLGKTGGASAALAFMAASGVRLHANPLGLPIGSQTYPHLARIQSGDLAGLVKDMKAIGIEQIELCSPGYTQFKSLADGKQTRKILDDNGMKAVSAHFTMPEYRNQNGFSHQKAIEWAHDVGLNQMSTASVLGKVTNGMTTLEEVKRACDEYNKIGAITKAAGLQQITHHEGFENSRIEDGRLTFPVLLEYYDPELVKMQFQMSSMLTVGDPIMYFTNHPGRFASMHLQGVDVTRGMRESRAGIPVPKPTPEQIAEAEAARAARAGGAGGRAGGAGGRGGNPGLAVGEDNVDWVKVFQAAKIGGVKTYFVEQNWDLTVKSVAFLKGLTVA